MNLPRYLSFAALLLLTQCSKCKQDDPQPQPQPELPAITQTGANTFGCLLNGQVWLPRAPGGISPSRTAEYNPVPDGSLTLFVTNASDAIYFRLRGVTGPGRYTILGGQPRYVEFSTPDINCQYDTLTSVQAGTVDITRFDQVEKIVSGRFAFTLRRPGCPDVLVTDGRFDLRYR